MEIKMAENTNPKNVEEIMNNVAVASVSDELSDDGIIVEFEDDGTSINIVFGAEDEEITVSEEDLTLSDKSLEEPPVAPEEKNTPKEEDEEEISVEQESNASDFVGAGIYATYVPRFTGASDNYRIRSSDAAENTVKKESIAPKITEFTPPVILPESNAEAPLDPTSEKLDGGSAIANATVVSSGNSFSSSFEEVTTVFKFVSESSPKVKGEAQAPAVETLKKEEEPLADKPEEESAKEEATFTAEEKEEPSDSEEEAKPYVMPDPYSANEVKVELPVARPVTALEIPDEQVRKKRKKSEYTSFSEKDGFLDSFLDGIMSLRVRIVAVAVLALLLLFTENASFIGIDITAFFSLKGLGGATALLTFPFTLGVFLLLLPEVIYSFTALMRRKLVPEIFLTVSFAAIFLYYIVLLGFASGNEHTLLGFVYSLFALFVLISSYYKKKADFVAFKIVSANGEKRVVDRKLTRNLPSEHRALDGKIESYKSRTARVFRTSFVSDFSARASIISENTAGNIIILSTSLGLSLVSALVVYFILDGIVSAALTFAIVEMLSVPVFTAISHKLPFYQATLEAAGENSAVIGESSFFDYAGIDVVTFDDTEIFGKDDVILKRIKVYGRQENFQKALQQMCALFTVVGGPLKYMFEKALVRRVSGADNVAVDTDGVIGFIDGVEVMAGSEEFMTSRGISIPEDETADSSFSKTTRIMYAAEGGEIYAKFCITYRLSEEFTMLLPLLLDEGMKPLVYTRDPNVNDSLFCSMTAGTDSIRTLKKQNLPENDSRLYQRISLGMVSVGDKTNIINTLLLSKKYASLLSKLAIAELPAMIGGAMMGIFLAICGPAKISSLLLSLWHIVWCAAVILIGKRTLFVKKEEEEEIAPDEEAEKDENSEEQD